jgi:RNA polymerase sigma-70 factor (ECF subfamily)
VWRAIATLAPDHREIVVLRDFHGLSYDELAHAIGIPIGTVMSRLHAARQRLRERLVEEGFHA